MHRILVYIACPLVVSSCNFFDSSKDIKEEPIARVYDKYLYQSDISGVGKGAARPEDSIQAVRNYIDSWVRHNILLRYAQDNLPDEEQQLDARLRDYKESLLIYLYENQLVSQKLDTTVSEEAIQKYYNDHKDIFSLKSGIAKVKYIMLPLNTRIPLDSVRTWLRDPNDYSQPKLEGFCKEYAIRYSISDSAWYNKDEMTSLLPVNQFNLDNAQYNTSYVEVADSGYGYMIKFNDYRIKGSDAPIDFARQEITNIIINQRKIAFIGSIHKSIYEAALKRGEFEEFVEEGKASKQEKKK